MIASLSALHPSGPSLATHENIVASVIIVRRVPNRLSLLRRLRRELERASKTLDVTVVVSDI